MCSDQLSHNTFDGWSCPNELEEWTRDGPQIQYSSLCPNTLNRNSSVYTDLTSTEYCMLTEYRMFCSIYPTSTRNPTVGDLQTKDRLETTILCIFLLCCALLSTTEHWRYRLEVDARIEVDAVYVVFEREAREFLFIISLSHANRNARSKCTLGYTLKYTLEYTLEYYENLTRASRSNTGWKRR